MRHMVSMVCFFSRASADRRPALRKETEIINCALGSYPRDTYRWTVHGLARELHVSRKTVQRTLKNYRITPRMLAGGGAVVDPESLILSVDPLFGRRIVAVAGLYYNMWDRALAFAVAPEAGLSEDRLRLDGGSGLFDAREIDALMAALNAMDTVMVFSRPPVGAAMLVSETEVAGFLKYLNHLDQKVAAEHDVHLIMQWYGMGVHRNLFARDWLSAHPRFQPHFVPRIMTWLRLVECWLDLIQRSGRDTPVLGVKLMVTAIDEFVRNGQGKAILGPWAIA